MRCLAGQWVEEHAREKYLLTKVPLSYPFG
jgi:hypothetical protein